jgi:TRAP-type C4-dicarboxylate transport system permease small subunit
MNSKGLHPLLKYLAEAVNWVGYISISAIVLVTSIDVIGRYIFNRPLLGSLELLELLMAVFGGFAILHTTTRRGHVSVDLLFAIFPRRLQIAVHAFGSIMGSAVWAIIAYRVFTLGKQSLLTRYYTTILYIPTGPFEIVLACTLGLFSLILLVQAFVPPSEKKSGNIEEELSI